MLRFEKTRQKREGKTPLGVYTARLLARKGAELYANVGELRGENLLREDHDRYNIVARGLPLSGTQRRRLVNDSHALVIDGIDRHRLWAGAAKKVAEVAENG